LQQQQSSKQTSYPLTNQASNLGQKQTTETLLANETHTFSGDIHFLRHLIASLHESNNMANCIHACMHHRHHHHHHILDQLLQFLQEFPGTLICQNPSHNACLQCIHSHELLGAS
jgi:hypothetical protein